MTPRSDERNGTLTKAVVSVVVALVIGLGSWVAWGLSETQQRVVRLETRQEQVDRTLETLAEKVDTIYEWVLKQRAVQESRGR